MSILFVPYANSSTKPARVNRQADASAVCEFVSIPSLSRAAGQRDCHSLAVAFLRDGERWANMGARVI